MGSLDKASSPPESPMVPPLTELVGTREVSFSSERRRRERETKSVTLRIYIDETFGVFL